MGMQTMAQTRRPMSLGSSLTILGLLIVLVAAVLYLTGISRATGVWIAPVGLVTAVLGVVSLRGRPVPRWLLVALGIVMAVLVLGGVVLIVYGLAHPPSGA